VSDQQKKWEAIREHVNSSAYYRLLGFEAVELGEGFARLRMPASKKLLQFQGAVHGGAVYSVADAAVAIALVTTCNPGEHVLTIEGKINHLAPVSEGEEIWAEARLVQRGRQIAVGDVEVKGDNGRMVAKGLITYMVVRR
jgi:uncharacterized protein (TIGR00369 family)